MHLKLWFGQAFNKGTVVCFLEFNGHFLPEPTSNLRGRSACIFCYQSVDATECIISLFSQAIGPKNKSTFTVLTTLFQTLPTQMTPSCWQGPQALYSHCYTLHNKQLANTTSTSTYPNVPCFPSTPMLQSVLTTKLQSPTTITLQSNTSVFTFAPMVAHIQTSTAE